MIPYFNVGDHVDKPIVEEQMHQSFMDEVGLHFDGKHNARRAQLKAESALFPAHRDGASRRRFCEPLLSPSSG